MGTHRYVITALPTSYKSKRDKLSGVYAFARTRGWRVQNAGGPPTCRPFAELLRLRRPDGVILDGNAPPERISPRLLAGIPTVYIDLDPRRAAGCRFVNHDSAASGRLAAETLLKLGLRHFCFIGHAAPVFWSRERGEGFRACICAAGGTYAACSVRAGDLAAWLAALPKPCGAFAATDLIAREVLDACQMANVAIPEDLALLGVDDDSDLCESVYPALTSVLPDFKLGGRLAAALLEAEMDGRDTRGLARRFGPQTVVFRGSTQRLNVNFAEIAKALDFIREFHGTGIGVREIANHLGISRRTLEMHFRQATGATVHDELHRVRMAHVKDLLLNTSKPISFIASICGFANDNYLKNLFKRECGCAMSVFRQRHLGRAFAARGTIF